MVLRDPTGTILVKFWNEKKRLVERYQVNDSISLNCLLLDVYAQTGTRSMIAEPDTNIQMVNSQGVFSLFKFLVFFRISCPFYPYKNLEHFALSEF